MKYAVEARVFYNGRVVTKIREAEAGEINFRTETNTCEIWVDVFDTKEEALRFQDEYKRT